MLFESARQGKTHFWRYLVTFIAAFLASNTIGAIPLLVVIFRSAATNPAILEDGSRNISDLTAFGVDPNVGLVLMIFPFIVGLLTLLLLIKPMHGRSFVTVFNGTKSVRWNKIFFAFIVWILFMAVYMIFSLKMDPDNFRLNNTSVTLIYLAIISIALIPFQTAFEEVLFRGYLMQGFSVWTRSKWWPLIITSIFFALMHSFNPEVKEFGFGLMIPQYLVFGLMFGLVTVLDDGIELALGAHAANNVFLSIIVTQKASALQTVALYEQQDVYPVSDLISLVIYAVLFVAILSFTFKWNWKESFIYKKQLQAQ